MVLSKFRNHRFINRTKRAVYSSFPFRPYSEAKKRTFSRAVWSQQAEDFPLLNKKAVQCTQVPVVFYQIVYLNKFCHVLPISALPYCALLPVYHKHSS